MFLRLFQHLLPNARAWRITVDKQLREFFDGLTGLSEDIKEFFDLVYLDISPDSTRELDLWEGQFGLPNVGLTDIERRSRLDAAWKTLGGQDINYIQNILQDNGFDVFVHEWWVPGTEAAVGVKACATPRNPFLVLVNDTNTFIAGPNCGEALALCGEASALSGETTLPRGYTLVNKILRTEPDFITLCGEAEAECGEANALAGNFLDLVDRFVIYQIPTDVDKWPYFLYIGGNVFGEQATVDAKRRDEFENLCLKICPAQQWLGIMVDYN